MSFILVLGLLSFSGLEANDAVPQIVGGRLAEPGEWSWQLALYANSAFHCGATIVGPTSAITAAHCVDRGRHYSIMAGSNNNKYSCRYGECVKRKITKIVLHPEYERNSTVGFPNDIAVIAWKDPIPEASGRMNVKYADMAMTSDQCGKKCYVTGWGRLYVPSGHWAFPALLHEAEVEVLRREECTRTWAEDLVTDRQVCAMDRKTLKKGPCERDDGGPLVCERAQNDWEFVGVLSWGAFGCLTFKPSVYTRISSYRDWIDHALNGTAEG